MGTIPARMPSHTPTGDGQTQHYTFDPMGNRLTKNGEAYTYNNANMLLTKGSDSYTNDPNGNTTSGGGRDNTWDSQNRLTQCVYNGHTSTFTYGVDGLRRRSVVDGVTTDSVIDGQSVVREMREGNPYATYLTGPRGPEYRRDSNGTKWYLYDGLGSVIAEVNSSGTVTGVTKYDVFGLVRDGGGTSTQHKFVGGLGHTTEDETGGLIYMRARWMDPALGRFISEDPAGNSVNWYAYCSSDPVNSGDRNGKVAEPIAVLWAGLSAAIGGAIGFIVGWLETVQLIHLFCDAKWKPNLTLALVGAFGTGLANAFMGWVASQMIHNYRIALMATRLTCSVAFFCAFVVGSCLGATMAAVEYWTRPEAQEAGGL